jgi:hypothetical protein
MEFLKSLTPHEALKAVTVVHIAKRIQGYSTAQTGTIKYATG